MRAAAAIVTLLSPVPLWAQDADICRQFIRSQGFEIEVSDVRDVGQGIVMELSTGTGTGSGSDLIAFQHCASGQMITAVMSSWDENGSVLAPANAYDIMMMAMESATEYGLADIVGQMKAARVDARLMTMPGETCGCRLFYPGSYGSQSSESAT